MGIKLPLSKKTRLFSYSLMSVLIFMNTQACSDTSTKEKAIKKPSQSIQIPSTTTAKEEGDNILQVDAMGIETTERDGTLSLEEALLLEEEALAVEEKILQERQAALDTEKQALSAKKEALRIKLQAITAKHDAEITPDEPVIDKEDSGVENPTLDDLTTKNPQTRPDPIVQPVTNTEAGKKILAIGKHMVFQTKEIVKGSCWDYINTVYIRAGYPYNKRVTVHKGTKDGGAYAEADDIQAGDWLYYINHSYNGIEHSGIFVNWVDKSKKIANILSYGGENRQEPGRYRNYDLSNVYTIIRPDNKDSESK